MKEELQLISDKAKGQILECTTLKELEALRVSVLGKKGELTAILKQMGKLTAEERPIMGQLVNTVKAELEELISTKETEIEQKEMVAALENETIDVTLPGKTIEVGKLHPITKVLNELKDLFLGMGFDIAEGPEVETDYYNFEALNLPKNHPARDTQDTFYIAENILLRTQTSPVQARVMEQQKPPIKIICPGRVYRSDAMDMTHSPLFHQIEGLVVDKGITMGDLIGTLETVMKSLYGEDAKIRLRPHHFPFTEPSAEVDVMCFNCHGDGCSMCKGEGYIELLGAGMVHPNVLRNCGIDPDEYSGFAFGLGLERIVMRRFGITDIRYFYENDLRFLNQF